MKLNDYEQMITNNMTALQGRRSDEEMAYFLGFKTAATYRTRLHKPGSLRLGEIERICQKMSVPMSEFLVNPLVRIKGGRK